MNRMTYTQALNRLEEIVRCIDTETPDIDKLTDLVSEAVGLTKFCKNKLTETDKKLTQLILQLEETKEL